MRICWVVYVWVTHSTLKGRGWVGFFQDSEMAGERLRCREGRGAWEGSIHLEKTTNCNAQDEQSERVTTCCCPQWWKEGKKVSLWEMSLCRGLSESARIYHWRLEVISTAVEENPLTCPLPMEGTHPGCHVLCCVHTHLVNFTDQEGNGHEALGWLCSQSEQSQFPVTFYDSSKHVNSFLSQTWIPTSSRKTFACTNLVSYWLLVNIGRCSCNKDHGHGLLYESLGSPWLFVDRVSCISQDFFNTIATYVL